MPTILQRASAPHRTYGWIADNDGNERARLTIDHLTMQIAPGVTAQVAAVGNVFTAESARGQGLASRLMEAVPELAPEAELSMLFGIDGYYVNLGYERAGDEWLITFPIRDEQSTHSGRIDSAQWNEWQTKGWSVTRSSAEQLRDAATVLERHSGSVIRTAEQWRMMHDELSSHTPGTSRSGTVTVLACPEGSLTAAMWTDDQHAVCAEVRASIPDQSILVPELLARDRESAQVLLSYCASVAPPGTSLCVAAHPSSTVSSLADEFDAQVLRTTRVRGGLMYVPLPPASAELVAALQSQLPRLWVPLADRW